MHEVTMLYQLAENTEKTAEENNISSVRTINLEVGELSGVLPDIFTEYFDYVVHSDSYPRLSKSVLNIHMVAGEGLCNDCQSLYNVMLNDGVCPVCKSRSKQVLGGTDVKLLSLEY